MNNTYPILRSLDPHHARVGYLGALATVATRGLDRQEALTARYHELLFERIYESDPRFAALVERAGEERRAEVLNRMIRTPDQDPSSILSPYVGPNPGAASSGLPVNERPEGPLGPERSAAPVGVKTDYLYTSELWLYDARMPSTTGLLTEEKLGRTLDLARWTEILLPTCELSETGFLLQHLVTGSRDAASPGGMNPLLAASRPALTALYLRILLSSEFLLPFLVAEMVERDDQGLPLKTRTEQGLLKQSLDRMLRTIGEPEDPADILGVIELGEFEKSLSKPSTAENYLRPRLEMLVDLGVVGRRPGIAEEKAKFQWLVTDVTRRFAAQLHPLQTKDNRTLEFLDREFLGALATSMDWRAAPVHRLEERLLWFARSYGAIGREFGFTPGRTLALHACLMALETGRLMEVEHAFDAVYDAARTPWANYLHYSGGSRFDREFLIRVDSEMVPALDRALGSEPGGGESNA